MPNELKMGHLNVGKYSDSGVDIAVMMACIPDAFNGLRRFGTTLMRRAKASTAEAAQAQKAQRDTVAIQSVS